MILKITDGELKLKTYDFKLKGGDVLRGRYLELLPPPPSVT